MTNPIISKQYQLECDLADKHKLSFFKKIVLSFGIFIHLSNI